MERNGQNFLSFWTIFCPFTPPHPNNLKNHNFEKNEKRPGVKPVKPTSLTPV